MRYAIPFLLVLAGLPASGIAAQDVPTTTLGEALVEFPEPFTQLMGVRELSDGRVVVADPRERALRVLDFGAGSSRQVGREGAGPGEWRLPMAVFGLPGDSTVVFDVGNMRYLVLTPEPAPAYDFSLVGAGQPGAAGRGPGGAAAGRPMPSGQQGRPPGAPQGAARGQVAAARTQAAAAGGGMLRGADGIDRRGMLYSTSSPLRIGPDGPEVADSVAVLRMSRDGTRTDTIASIHRPGAQASGSTTSGGTQVRLVIGAGTPFDPRDEWAVAPDGRVAVVRHSPYRVEWVAPAGTVTRGPVQPYTPIRITNADREAAAEARARAGGLRVMAGPGGTQVTMGAGAMPEASDVAWPETKPPFTAGAARVAPNGHLWVLRTRAASDQVPRYDVFDGAGRLVHRVALPRETRLLGFGESTVYVVRRDADDLEYVQRLSSAGLFGGR